MAGRVNAEVTLIGPTTSAGTSTQGSAVQTNDVFRGVEVVTRISSLSTGDPTLTVTVEGRQPQSTGSFYTVVQSSALGSTGLHTLTVFPGASTAANQRASRPLPRSWRVRTTQASTGAQPSVTFGVGAHLVI